jgi:RNA polymerase sigma factor (sigma-70 family)
MVVKWTLGEHFQGRPTDVPLPDGWDVAVAENGFHSFEERFDLERLFEGLPDGDRAVCRLRYIEGLEIAEIALRLAMQRNAVDQALFRAHRQLRDLANAS